MMFQELLQNSANSIALTDFCFTIHLSDLVILFLLLNKITSADNNYIKLTVRYETAYIHLMI